MSICKSEEQLIILYRLKKIRRVVILQMQVFACTKGHSQESNLKFHKQLFQRKRSDTVAEYASKQVQSETSSNQLDKLLFKQRMVLKSKIKSRYFQITPQISTSIIKTILKMDSVIKTQLFKSSSKTSPKTETCLTVLRM
jgi:hypothetical protein